MSENQDKAVLPTLCDSTDHLLVSMAGSAGTADLSRFANKLVTIQPSVDTYVFASSSPTDGTAEPAGTDGAANRGRLLKAGESYDFFIPERQATLRHHAVTGSLHIYRSSR